MTRVCENLLNMYRDLAVNLIPCMSLSHSIHGPNSIGFQINLQHLLTYSTAHHEFRSLFYREFTYNVDGIKHGPKETTQRGHPNINYIFIEYTAVN